MSIQDKLDNTVPETIEKTKKPKKKPKVTMKAEDLKDLNDVVEQIRCLDIEIKRFEENITNGWMLFEPKQMDRRHGSMLGSPYNYEPLLKELERFGVSCILQNLQEKKQEKEDYLLNEYGYEHKEIETRGNKEDAINVLPGISDNGTITIGEGYPLAGTNPDDCLVFTGDGSFTSISTDAVTKGYIDANTLTPEDVMDAMRQVMEEEKQKESD